MTIASPDGKLFSGLVQRIILRGAEGDLAVMAGHVPFITNVKPDSRCAVHLEDGTVKEGTTGGGLLTVGKDEVTYLTAGINWD